MAARGDREAANCLDALKGLVALMLAHRLAEQPAKEPHVVVQSMIAFRLRPLRRGGRRNGGGGSGGSVFFDIHEVSRSLAKPAGGGFSIADFEPTRTGAAKPLAAALPARSKLTKRRATASSATDASDTIAMRPATFGAAPMLAPSSPNIFDQWDTYHKVVAANFMFHREIAEALRRALEARFSGRLPAFLDLGCGDATAPAPGPAGPGAAPLQGRRSLGDGARARRARTDRSAFLVTLTHGDILEALDEDESDDVIHSSFVLHHLPTERKAEFFRRAARRLAPEGLLLLVDVVREEDELLDDYFRRYCGWLRREWRGLSAEELDAICDHLVNNDLPEPYSTLVALARAAGLKEAPGGVHYGAHRLLSFARE